MRLSLKIDNTYSFEIFKAILQDKKDTFKTLNALVNLKPTDAEYSVIIEIDKDWTKIEFRDSPSTLVELKVKPSDDN